MCLSYFVAFKSGYMYSFLPLFMVLIARCVRSELSLDDDQCSPASVNSTFESEYQLRYQISDLSDRVHGLQAVLYDTIQEYGPQTLKQCPEYTYTSEPLHMPICILFNSLPNSERASCPQGTMCNTGRMRQHLPTRAHLPWDRESSISCDHDLAEWTPITHHISVLQIYHTQLVNNILAGAHHLQHQALLDSMDVMANTFHEVLCGMEITRQRLEHPSLTGDEGYELESQISYEGVSLNLQNIVILQSLQDMLEHISQDLLCLNYRLPVPGKTEKRNSNSFPAWIAQQRHARLQKKSWSSNNVISKLLRSLRN